VERSGGDGPFPIRVDAGARAVEAALLDEVAALAEAGVDEPRLLRLPVRVIVSSRSLREHVAAALTRRFGRAIAGVSVQTLHAVALEIVERSGGGLPGGDALFPILVRRHAREEPALRERLEDLLDGYGIVTDDVTDLLDAGFEVEHADAIEEALGELSRFPTLIERARALVRVTTRTLASMQALNVGHRAQLVRRARELLERRPDRALPARAVLIHGFAEATCLRADLLEALVRHRGARAFLDEPPDPADPTAPDAGRRFGERLRARFEGVAGVDLAPAAPVAPATVVAREAPGAHAEVRAVAGEIRRQLDAGRRPEGFAVVARDIAIYRTAVRLHFRRLGIPFSGVGETGSAGATRRRVQALLDLLQRRDRAPADRWLDAAVRLDPAEDLGVRSDLRLGLRHIGAVSLEDVAQHRAGPGDVALPAIGAWRDPDEAEPGASGGRAGRRYLRGEDLARATRAAKRVRQRLERLGSSTHLAAQLEQIGELLADDLGWDRTQPEYAPVFSQLDGLRGELPPDLALRDDDFLQLLCRALERVGDQPIGGQGGGVQVLSVMEARARTFEELFLLGLNRDVFPRNVRQDPLLPDMLRRAMAVALPDLPIKATGHDEERYLFAQLLSASPRVHLSWQTATDDGKDCAPSTLIERIRWGTREFAPIPVPSLYARPRGSGDTPGEASLRTPLEQVLLTGLYAARADFADVLPVAFEELHALLPAAVRSDRPDAAVRGRLAVLAEFDSRRRGEASLGPYFGFTGAPTAAADPRHAAFYVTTVEGMARCPWQTFLSKLLRLEAPPDPLEALPGSDPRLLGMVVHRCLERIASDAVGASPASLDEARGRPGVPVPWPDAARLDALLHDAARGALDDEGIALRGLERVLALQAQPLLERARDLDWPDAGAPVNVLGVELEGAIVREVARGERRELRFRADRVDAADGDLVLTDYKTGKPISDAARPETRARHLLRAVAEGRHLQAVVYALAAGAAGGTGRFLFLKPELRMDAAASVVRADCEDVVAAFESALGAVASAWDAGAFFPRLLDKDLEKENPDCERCELAEACLRGDTGWRQRFAHWVEAARGGAAEAAGADERALLAVWSLRGVTATRPSGARH
jgi:hypothetical protein